MKTNAIYHAILMKSKPATLIGSAILNAKILKCNININIGNYSNIHPIDNLISVSGIGKLTLGGKLIGGEKVAVKVSDSVTISTGNCRIDSTGSTILGSRIRYFDFERLDNCVINAAYCN